MRPDSVCFTAVILSVTCIDEEHLVHFSIAVPVVVGKIHFILNALTGLNHHFIGIRVVLFLAVSAVIVHSPAQQHGAHHVKVDVELAVTLRKKIVAHRARQSAFRQSNLIESFLKRGLWQRSNELHVLVFHQNHQSFLLSHYRVEAAKTHLVAVRSLSQSFGIASVQSAAPLGTHLSLVHELCFTVLIYDSRAAI